MATKHAPSPTLVRNSSGRFYVLLAGAIGLVLVGWAAWERGLFAQRPASSSLTLADIPFQGERAYGYLKEICAIGPRVSGTAGMTKQQELLTAHFEKLGAKVSRQEFQARHPQTGNFVGMTNLIVEWHPERKERILLCGHYDTRPFPDEDPINPRGEFLGANDGGSSTALLMELGNEMPGLKCKYGIDFVFFDGEELVFDKARDPYFLGSEYFARAYVAEPPAHKYKAAVLLDMVGDKQLALFREVNSLRTVPQRALVADIWGVAERLKVKEFIPYTRYEVRDDHLALNEIARIPAIDIIDFEYPTSRGPNYWHTTQDIPENCSALSLAKVGWVVRTWLERVK
ncbi:MAG: M28 family peptidase [Pirellulaceae bacterium]|nr:M28 family peptidase [Pirellulaceae bacterium]